MSPKDTDTIIKRSGVIYRYRCARVVCDNEYIGESARTFGEMLKEQLKALSPIYDYYNTTGHSTIVDNFSIVEKEDQDLAISINESIHIRINGQSLNRNISKYHLQPIWDMVLCNTRLKKALT